MQHAWFTESRFGMFVHWGLYSLAARHEWVKSREHLTDEDYQPYFDHFDPDLYDPREWARLAKAAGMRYVVLTTKHHDGFCLWDSAQTDYKSTRTPYGKDLVGPFVAAVREQGLRVGFYHSLLDWHHPEFPVDCHHPQRDDEEFKAANAGRDITKYTDYLHAQVRELLTGYGTIDYLFFDFSYAGRPGRWGGKGAADWRSTELLAMVRELQPEIIVNDRLDIDGDFLTPEQYQPAAPLRSGGATRSLAPQPWIERECSRIHSPITARVSRARGSSRPRPVGPTLSSRLPFLATLSTSMRTRRSGDLSSKLSRS